MAGPRPTGSSPPSRAHAARFGAPVTEPPGGSARSTSSTPDARPQPPDDGRPACHRPAHSLERRTAARPAPDPGASRGPGRCAPGRRSSRARPGPWRCRAAARAARSAGRALDGHGRDPRRPPTRTSCSGDAHPTAQPSPPAPRRPRPGSAATRSQRAGSPVRGAAVPDHVGLVDVAATRSPADLLRPRRRAQRRSRSSATHRRRPARRCRLGPTGGRRPPRTRAPAPGSAAGRQTGQSAQPWAPTAGPPRVPPRRPGGPQPDPGEHASSSLPPGTSPPSPG